MHIFLCDHMFVMVVDQILSVLQGKMDAAASMIEKAIMANPTYAEAYNNLGLSLSLSNTHLCPHATL